MFQIRSIAIRLILAISLTVAAACAILGTFSVMQERSLMRLALDQQLKLQYDSVIAAVDYEGRAALAVTAVLAAMPPIQSIVCFIQVCNCSGEATLLPSSCLKININSSIVLHFKINNYTFSIL